MCRVNEYERRAREEAGEGWDGDVPPWRRGPCRSRSGQEEGCLRSSQPSRLLLSCQAGGPVDWEDERSPGTWCSGWSSCSSRSDELRAIATCPRNFSLHTALLPISSSPEHFSGAVDLSHVSPSGSHLSGRRDEMCLSILLFLITKKPHRDFSGNAIPWGGIICKAIQRLA